MINENPRLICVCFLAPHPFVAPGPKISRLTCNKELTHAGTFFGFDSTGATLMTGSRSRNQTEDGRRLQSVSRGNVALTSEAADPRVTP